ncbi:PREDICTED: vesicle-associated membrane protein 724-like [Tarenaya hassleriana]|uniref:vesicle-associated membrane protein 724-like n=1 Tax=Tarenaya hassleriana TaxID=28532 RepID=UPI0008FCFBE1|nr:PREDICTED: vesicle-associated membrane protein 724-like [Tarenaya hassleriana]
MSQETFIYSFVARGAMILAEYTDFTGNFPAIAAQCLQKLPSSINSKFTYNCDLHTFNFLVEDGYTYCVVAKDSLSKQISIAFLERMKADFKKRYGGGKASTAFAKSLNKEFGPIMKEHMKYWRILTRRLTEGKTLQFWLTRPRVYVLRLRSTGNRGHRSGGKCATEESKEKLVSPEFDAQWAKANAASEILEPRKRDRDRDRRKVRGRETVLLVVL